MGTQKSTGIAQLFVLSVAFCSGCGPSKANLKVVTPIKGCVRIKGAIGPEDFQYLKASNALVISSHDKRDFEKHTGRLYWMDLSVPVEQQRVVAINTSYPKDFRPHGISFVPSETGGTLYVISHPRKGKHRHTIEVFSFNASDNKWKHIKTLRSELLISPNNLVALSDGSLFISHDNFDLGGSFSQALDAIFGRERAPITFFDGKKFHDFKNPATLGNGVLYFRQREKDYLYRAASVANALIKFRILRKDNKIVGLKRVAKIDLKTGPDNLLADSSGNLYTAGHFAPGLLLDHEEDAKVKSPTQVLRITPQGKVTELYSNRGEEISAGSVALPINKRLYIGQVYDEGILSCPLK